jgi:hypothetical protein
VEPMPLLIGNAIFSSLPCGRGWSYTKLPRLFYFILLSSSAGRDSSFWSLLRATRSGADLLRDQSTWPDGSALQ